VSFGSLLSPLSNPKNLLKIGFSKKERFQTSHDDLIIDWFSGEKLNKVQSVTVLTFRPGNNIAKTIFHPISVTFYEICI